jgi:hypothetical protein
MSKLLDLFSEQRRRQACDHAVRFFHWTDFDKTALLTGFGLRLR